MDAAALYRQYAGEAGFDLDALRSVMQTLGTPRDDADLAQLLTHLDADGKSVQIFLQRSNEERSLSLFLWVCRGEERRRTLRGGREELHFMHLHFSMGLFAGQWRHTGRQPFTLFRSEAQADAHRFLRVLMIVIFFPWLAALHAFLANGGSPASFRRRPLSLVFHQILVRRCQVTVSSPRPTFVPQWPALVVDCNSGMTTREQTTTTHVPPGATLRLQAIIMLAGALRVAPALGLTLTKMARGMTRKTTTHGGVRPSEFLWRRWESKWA